ncbi:MAG: histidinol dehydrogenase [Chloroflexi bacterium]|nr:histidinol dehydrogenase [Chloroflexota bacterium]
MLRIITSVEEARATLLRRAPLDESDVPPAVAARIAELFGGPLTPEEAVRRIVRDVRARGDAALRDWSLRLDGVAPDPLEVPRAEMQRAYQSVRPEVADALRLAAERIRAFHAKQVRHSWIEFEGGTALGQLVRPLARVGLYAPGGRAAYPSTVLMTAVPARVAGVGEVVLATPPARDGAVSPAVLVAADIAGVDRVFRMGGAQAIAALAYGTASVPRVDKLFGPGNIFVTLAKREVFGVVGIDQLAGPSEALLLADKSADADTLAAELLTQAEHDPQATALLLTDSRAQAEAVDAAVERQLAALPRRAIIAEALERQGGVVVVPDLAVGMALANEFAPEHFCLFVADPWALLGQVRNAGAVFVGAQSPHVMGDYVAGPSHVLPTGGAARFASPLHVGDFVKLSSVLAVGPADVARLGPAAMAIGGAEGLDAHVAAIARRLAPSSAQTDG